MGITTDPNDPGLKKIEPSGMQASYLVLSDEERAMDVLDAAGMVEQSTKYKVGDRVRVKFGRMRGYYATIVSKGGDDGTYYGITLADGGNPIGYSEYELDPA